MIAINSRYCDDSKMTPTGYDDFVLLSVDNTDNNTVIVDNVLRNNTHYQLQL